MSCRIPHKLRFRGEQLSAHFWLWFCPRIYYAFLRLVILLPSWKIKQNTSLGVCLHCSLIRCEYSCGIVGDEEEWEQQCAWHSAFMSGLDKVDVSMDRLQQDNEKWTSQAGEWSTNLNETVRTIVSGHIPDITDRWFFWSKIRKSLTKSRFVLNRCTTDHMILTI